MYTREKHHPAAPVAPDVPATSAAPATPAIPAAPHAGALATDCVQSLVGFDCTGHCTHGQAPASHMILHHFETIQ